jgi:hypothetical protein
MKSRRRRRRTKRRAGALAVHPSPLSLAIRTALRRHVGLTSALTLGVVLSNGFTTKAAERDAPAAGLGASAQQTAVVDEGLVVIDPAVPEYQRLLTGVRPGLRTVVLDGGRDGLAQLGELLAAHRGVRAVHLVAHGEPGGLRLGNTWVRREELEAQRAGLSRWFGPHATPPELIVYGCNVAAGVRGKAFVARLSALTGADVAASDDATGARARGGDWMLEHASGRIDSAPAFTDAVMAGYPHVLADVTVSTTADVVDGNTLSIDVLKANPGADGQISLREAVIASNNGSGADNIDLPSGFYSLTLGGTNEDGAAVGDLDVVGTTTIRGVSPNLTVIDATGLGDRVFHVLEDGNLTLENAKVSGGTAVGEPVQRKGGGIFVDGIDHNEGTVTLMNSTVSGNSASEGGGIFSYGTVTLTSSTISGNSAPIGAGIESSFACAFGCAGTLTLTDSTVSNNGGDGIRERGGPATLTNSTVSGNDGYGIRTSGAATVTVTNSTVSGNDGGGIFNHGTYRETSTLVLMNTTISGNGAAGGAGLRNRGTATVTNSTISGNNYTGISNYGGTYHSGTATVTNSTISGNQGGIRNYDTATLTLTNSTISSNQWSIWNPGLVTLTNSIVASAVGDNCFVSGSIVDGGGNLADDATCGSIPATAPADIALGPLADNGGPTQTHALLAGSVAIDAIPCADPPGTDQRGVVRPQGAQCDIGAYEDDDADDDGVPDDQDAFPMNPGESVDSDGDGMGDNFENQFGVDEPGADPDGDGVSNLDEFLNNTNPRVHNDAPAVITIINSILSNDN